MEKLNELPQAFYGVIQGGKVVMLPAEDGQWLNKTSVAEAVRELEQRAEAAEGRSKMLADDLLIERTFHNETLEREDLLKAKLAGLAALVPGEMPRSLVEEVSWRSEKKDGLECYHMENLKRAYVPIRAAILRNIEQADRDKFFKFLKDTSAIVDSWPDWKKQGSDVVKFLNPSPSTEVVDDSCPKGSVHEWVHHAPCYNPDYEECNKCGQRKECSENE